MREVAIIGIGCIKVGEHWDRSLRQLFAEAALTALEDAGVDRVDGVYVGNLASATLNSQQHLGALMADAMGMPGVEAVRVEAADASGGVAVHEAVRAVASGMLDLAVAGGVEKMTDAKLPDVEYAIMMSERREYVTHTGVTITGLNAITAQLYMSRFGAKYEDLVLFSVNDHKNAVNNPYAQYPFPITVERVLESPMVADPIRLLDTPGVGDGAAAVVLCPMERAREFTDTPIRVGASTVATDVVNPYEREELLTLSSTRTAAERAYEMAGVTPGDVDVVEVHDNSSVMGVIALEDLGFVEKGCGHKFVAEGEIEIGGKLPTNTFGGLKARGHPWGATGVYQVVELVWQLRGEAGKNQVDGAEVGLAQNVGGTGATSCIHILRRVD